MLYLLQLVQALKFESLTSSDQRSSRSANSAISQEDSGLGDFLIDRAVKNTVFGNRFYWYLMVEIGVEDKVTSKLYARVVYRFQNRIAEVSAFSDRISHSHLHVVRLMVLSDEIFCVDKQNSFRFYPTKPRNFEPTRTLAQRRLTNYAHS
jgi:Phosphoinositide 3-kinase family, accessory domain (PIK domain)